MTEPGDTYRNRTYGRRKGHKLSARRQNLVDELLPRLRPDTAQPFNTEQLFGGQVSDLWLEIGFGAGEHLLWQAAENPDVGFIGCEPFINGVANLLAGIDEQGLENVRVHDGDAREILPWIASGSIGRIFLLYPDPWPKARHAKRRFINAATLEELSRIMRPGAELRIASDIGDYLRTALETLMPSPDFEWLAERPSDWRNRPEDWPRTRYEEKALREGRKGHYLRFMRT